MIGQSQFRNHLRPQHAGNIRSSRNPAARSDLLGHATSADDFTALEHQRGKSATRQIRRRSQAVVTAANNNRVINKVGSRFDQANRNSNKSDSKSRRIAARNHTLLYYPLKMKLKVKAHLLYAFVTWSHS